MTLLFTTERQKKVVISKKRKLLRNLKHFKESPGRLWQEIDSLLFAIFHFTGRLWRQNAQQPRRKLHRYQCIWKHSSQYYLQPGDKLDITFYLNPELNENVIVRLTAGFHSSWLTRLKLQGYPPSSKSFLPKNIPALKESQSFRKHKILRRAAGVCRGWG